MPIQECSQDGKGGYRYGQSGTCYTHDGTDAGKARAKKKAVKQALAIGGGKAPTDLSEADLELSETKACAACGSRYARDRFTADARTSDGLSKVCVGCRFNDDRSMGELETVNLDGVPILAAGGPYYGQGSPDEGDNFDAGFLDELAGAYTELRHEVKVPIKIGHSRAQKLLKNSGLFADEMPAAGWVENIRREGDKLLADLRKVPKKIADLIDSGAFRTRSVEMSKVKSQTNDGKEYPIAVTALALLGAKAPAVRTLDDIVTAYYSDRDGDKPDTLELLYEDQAEPDVRSVNYAVGDVIWDSENGTRDWQDDLTAALNANVAAPTDGSAEVSAQPYYVEDIDQLNRRAIVCDWRTNAHWVVPFSTDENGEPVPAPQEAWTLAEQAWVEAAADNASTLPNTGDLSDRNLAQKGDTHDVDVKDNKPVLTDEQVAAFAEQFGIEEDDAAKKRDAVLAKFAEFAEQTPPPEPPTPPTPPTPAEPTPAQPAAQLSEKDLDELREKAALGERAYAEHKRLRVEGALDKALRGGMIDPESLPRWRDLAATDEELFITQLVAQPVNLARMRAYGDERKPENTPDDDDAVYRAYAGQTGVSVPTREAVSQ